MNNNYGKDTINMDEIEAEILEAEKRVADLKRKKNMVNQLSDAQRLAIELHNGCRIEHTEMCGWFYEIDRRTGAANWNNYVHRSYLDRAERILSLTGSDADTIIEVIKIVNRP